MDLADFWDSVTEALGGYGPAVRIIGLVLAGIATSLILRVVIRRIVNQVVRGVKRAHKVDDTRELTSSPLAAMRSVQRTRTLGSVLNNTSTWVIVTVVAILALTELGFSVTALVASAGILGAALGFGAQSLIKDVLNGLFMVFEDQLGVGDVVDLGVAEATSGFAVGFTSTDLFLTAELSALEASGEGEVVSQPKVITGDKQKASIKSGTEIPYQEGAASGATTTAFKEAVLKLDVTPNITPDDRILLDLVVNQDSVGDLVPSGNGGLIPTIDTTELMTQVLVGNGETVVLGGVFKNEELVKVEKVPLLGDIPYLGNLFKSTANSQQKTETLIFITPRILSEALVN